MIELASNKEVIDRAHEIRYSSLLVKMHLANYLERNFVDINLFEENLESCNLSLLLDET